MKVRMQIDMTALRRTLRKLPQHMQTQVEKKAMRAGARVIAKEIRARAPVDKGDLRKSVTVATASKEHRAAGSGPIVIGFKQPAGRMAHLLEFGTAHHAAQPFLRPAIEAKADEAIAATAKSMNKGLESAAKKLAGPKGRAAFNKKARRR